MTNSQRTKYKRVLLKLSGEALGKPGESIFDPEAMSYIAAMRHAWNRDCTYCLFILLKKK